MITKPKDMNTVTWRHVQRAIDMMKSEKIDFETAYVRCGKASGISAGTDFLVKVESTMADRKITRGAATKIVVAENPKLHSDWLAESQNKTKKER